MAIDYLAPSKLRGGGLPAQPNVLVGRAAEVRWIRDRLRSDDTRLLTLLGPAGTGKTRLAIEVVREVVDAFPDGVYFVDLSPLRDEGLLASAIAQVLDVRAQSERPLVEVLKAYLAQRRVLLLLDNFEQLMPAAPLFHLLSRSRRRPPALSAAKRKDEASRQASRGDEKPALKRGTASRGGICASQNAGSVET